MPLNSTDNSQWLCPNLNDPDLNDTLTLQNDPNTYEFGKNLGFVVNYCDVAAAANFQASVKGMNTINLNCKSRTEINAYMQNLKVKWKFVRQYFNPRSKYYKFGKMDYISENRKSCS